MEKILSISMTENELRQLDLVLSTEEARIVKEYGEAPKEAGNLFDNGALMDAITPYRRIRNCIEYLLEEFNKDELETRIQELEEENQELRDKIDNANSTLYDLQSSLSRTRDNLDDALSYLDDCEESANELEDDLSE